MPFLCCEHDSYPLFSQFILHVARGVYLEGGGACKPKHSPEMNDFEVAERWSDWTSLTSVLSRGARPLRNAVATIDWLEP